MGGGGWVTLQKLKYNFLFVKQAGDLSVIFSTENVKCVTIQVYRHFF